MKKIVFLLLAVFTLSTSFTSAPVVDSKDNWVYNLKPIKFEAKDPSGFTIQSRYYDNTCDGDVIIHVVSDGGAQPFPREITTWVQIKYARGQGIGYQWFFYTWTFPANFDNIYNTIPTTATGCSRELGQAGTM